MTDKRPETYFKTKDDSFTLCILDSNLETCSNFLNSLNRQVLSPDIDFNNEYSEVRSHISGLSAFAKFLITVHRQEKEELNHELVTSTDTSFSSDESYETSIYSTNLSRLTAVSARRSEPFIYDSRTSLGIPIRARSHTPARPPLASLSAFSLKPSISFNKSHENLADHDSASVYKTMIDSRSEVYSTQTPVYSGFRSNSKASKLLGINEEDLKTNGSNTADLRSSLSKLQSEIGSIGRKSKIIQPAIPLPVVILSHAIKGSNFSGWIQVYKASTGILSRNSWKSRFIVLNQILMFRFNHTDPDSLASDIVQFNPQSYVCVTEEFKSEKHVIKVDNPGRGSLFLKAETLYEMKSWINHLKSAVTQSKFLMKGLPEAPGTSSNPSLSSSSISNRPFKPESILGYPLPSLLLSS